MRIAVVGSQLHALVNFRGPLMREMTARGHQVCAICPEGPARYRELLTQWGVEYQPIFLDRAGLNPLKDLKTMRSFLNAFKAANPDVIYAYTIKPVIYGSWAARWLGIHSTYSTITGLGHVFLENSTRVKAVRVVAKRMYQTAFWNNEKVFFQNQDDRRSFVDWGLVPEHKTHVVNGSGVDLEQFQVSAVPISPIRFIFIGRLLREKGIVELMEATRIVRERFPDVVVDVVGDLDENPSGVGEEEVAGWEAEGLIRRVGFVDDVRPFLTKASVFVLPSYREGTSRSTLEALATGRPIISTDAPGCREPVEHGVNGYLVPVRDAQQLAEAMLNCLEHPEDLQKMGDASRRLADTRYDVQLVNADILKQMGL